MSKTNRNLEIMYGLYQIARIPNDLEWVWRTLMLLQVTKRVARSLCLCTASCCVCVDAVIGVC